jgi:hypothetical protein
MFAKVFVPELLVLMAALCVIAFVTNLFSRSAGRAVARGVYVAFALLLVLWTWEQLGPISPLE